MGVVHGSMGDWIVYMSRVNFAVSDSAEAVFEILMTTLILHVHVVTKAVAGQHEACMCECCHCDYFVGCS